MQRLIDQHPLRRGAHPTRDDGMCAMEMVAWLAGEEHSDEPVCACPVMAAFVRACNDSMSDVARDRHLRPLVPQLVNTRGSAAAERMRGYLAIDALVRTFLPAWLERHGRRDEAQLLAALAPVQRLEDVRTAQRAVETFVPQQHATRWVLQRAVEGTPPARFVAGVVHVVRTLHAGAMWPEVAALIQRMARAEAAPTVGFAAE